MNSKFASVIKNDFENLKQDRAISTSHSRTTEAADCNCRWSCGDAPSQCTHSNCNTTSWGCGFLWLMSCEQRDELLAENCP